MALIAAGAVVVASGTEHDAGKALEGSTKLYRARLDVARAEEELGTSDFAKAIATANEANASAVKVGAVTKRIVQLLDGTRSAADDITAATERGANTVEFTRRQTALAAGILEAISGYQSSATRYASVSNKALERILRALRATNRSFP
jgi:conjugal transfer/entry exclusion protein